MSEKQETIPDIIAEMRLGATGDMPFAYRIGRPDRIVEYKTEDGKKYAQRSTVIESVTIDELADRLEAAHRRERGDCAMSREVLKRAWLFISATRESFAYVHEGLIERDKLRNDIDAALAAPPRNCDVGTAEEQAQRFDAFCDAHKYVGDDGTNWCSTSCPCYDSLDCGVEWAQMPYEEGGAK